MMNNIALVILIGLMLFSCKKDSVIQEDQKLVGKWKLIEQLADPGDGSGVFKSVISEKTIEFLDNGTIISSGTLCAMRIEKGQESVGTYTLSDGYIIPDGCATESKVFFEIRDSNLILSYLCIEGCSQKFKKLTIRD